MGIKFGTQNAAVSKKDGRDGFRHIEIKISRIEPDWFANAEWYWENRGEVMK